MKKSKTKIKFRLWDNSSKKMVASPILNTRDLEKKEINEIFSEENDGRWMLYTNVKDKNGLEVYENDIVISSYPVGYSECMAHPMLVKFEEGMFILKSKVATLNTLCTPYIEVIGNIFESPGLLEKRQ